MADVAVARRWLELIAGSEEIAGEHGRLVGARQKRFDALRGPAAASAPAAHSPGRTEQQLDRCMAIG